MVGTLVGLAFSFGVITSTWARELDVVVGGVPRAWAFVGIALVAGYIVTMVAPRTTGSLAMFATLGAFIAAVLALFTGQAAYALPLLATSLVGIFIQKGAAIALGRGVA